MTLLAIVFCFCYLLFIDLFLLMFSLSFLLYRISPRPHLCSTFTERWASVSRLIFPPSLASSLFLYLQIYVCLAFSC